MRPAVQYSRSKGVTAHSTLKYCAAQRSPQWPGLFGAAVPQDTAALKETVVGIDAFENVRPHWAGAMRCDVASSMRHATWRTTAAADGALMSRGRSA